MIVAQATPPPPPMPVRIAVTAAAFTGVPRRTVQATDEAGHTDTYSGYALDDLLIKNGAPHGAPVRGKVMAAYVMVGASDAYHVIFAMPELDPSFTDRVVLIADQKDGQPITSAGPFRLIVPGEKREARWVRNVTDVELVNAPTP